MLHLDLTVRLNVVASEKSHRNDKLPSNLLDTCIVPQNSLESRGEVHGVFNFKYFTFHITDPNWTRRELM